MSAINFDKSNNSLENKPEIKATDTTVSIAVEKLSSFNVIHRLGFLASETVIKKTVVCLNFNTDKILLKISDLSKVLGISEQEIIQLEESNKLDKIIHLMTQGVYRSLPTPTAFEFKSSDLSFVKHIMDTSKLPFEELAKFQKLEELRILDGVATDLQVRLATLLTSEDGMEIGEIITTAIKVKDNCEHMFTKLDALYKKVGGNFLSQDSTTLSFEILQAIKQIILQESQNFARNAKEIGYGKILKVHNYGIVLQPSDQALKITGLFGKVLGKGVFGVAIQNVDISTGKWAKGQHAVLKIPTSEPKSNAQIINEVALLKKIHSETLASGIQKPLILMDGPKPSHVGPMYQGDLRTLLDKNSLSPEDKLSMCYQLMTGISFIHEKKKITHGDIKVDNVFYNIKKGKAPSVFLSDFGGAIDHSADSVSLPITTPIFRVLSDNDATLKAHRDNERELYFTIEKKADVFAACTTLYGILTNGMPYNPKKILKGEIEMDPNAKFWLMRAGTDMALANAIIAGLSADYTQRPDAEQIRALLQKRLTLKGR